MAACSAPYSDMHVTASRLSDSVPPLHRVVGALWHGGIRRRQRFGSICEWRRRHEEMEADSWRGIELRNDGKAALDDGRHLPKLRKREREAAVRKEKASASEPELTGGGSGTGMTWQ
uniref:Uncharacterized protein n=1 Tax=Oryza nivara TaxID=4536 RepID=A0A0E0GW61_ORYNI